jgi:hypothetical protein
MGNLALNTGLNLDRKAPRDRRKNLLYRRAVLERALTSSSLRAELREACRRDILFYVNTFVWTYAPKGIGPRLCPFITWDFQDDAIAKIISHIQEQRPLVFEKSRDMGASWMCLIAMEWLWHFHPFTQCLMVSRDLEAVDGRSPDSLGWKIDFIHRFTPEWLLPAMKRRVHSFQNMDTGSTMTMTASTEKMGIGGRATVMFFDEFSRIERAFDIYGSTADTAMCRIFNSTHTGPGTCFHMLTTPGVMDKIVLHWTQHPDKGKGIYRWDDEAKRIEILDKANPPAHDYPYVMTVAPAGGPRPGIRSPWYDETSRQRGSSRAVAMDLDIDVQGSSALFFDQMMIRNLVAEYCCPPFWQGDVSYDKKTGKSPVLIPNPNGKLKLWLVPDAKGLVPEGVYTAGADVAAGTGASPSCLSIGNARTGEKVAEFTDGTINPKDFGVMACALCRLFCSQDREPAMLIWEKAGPGINFGNAVLETDFRNVYLAADETPFAPNGHTRPGWVNRLESLIVLLEDYRSALATRMYINRSEGALRECLEFRYNLHGEVQSSVLDSPNDPSGARTQHGDHVIADALQWKIAKSHYRSVALTPAPPKPLDIFSLAYRRRLWEDQQRAGAEY